MYELEHFSCRDDRSVVPTRALRRIVAGFENHQHGDKVKIVAGRHEADAKRLVEPGKPSTLPEHRAARLAVIRGKRGKPRLVATYETG